MLATRSHQHNSLKNQVDAKAITTIATRFIDQVNGGSLFAATTSNGYCRAPKKVAGTGMAWKIILHHQDSSYPLLGPKNKASSANTTPCLAYQNWRRMMNPPYKTKVIAGTIKHLKSTLATPMGRPHNAR
jgi:hypothetical protein